MNALAHVPAHIIEKIQATLKATQSQAIALSHSLHAEPEIGGEEHRSVAKAAKVLSNAGFTLETMPGTLPTALSARFGTGELVVGLCIEYDALPEIGHACGHNVHGAASVAAALALAQVSDELGITVKALGTPAEESFGGKVDLINAGFFDDVSLAMMVHAAGEDSVKGSSLALTMWDVLYLGKPAHAAAAPEHGVNALDALVIAQTAIGLNRQQLPRDTVVSVIVHEAGTAVNVIPDRARASVEMRAPSQEILDIVKDRVRRCLEAGALASGASLETHQVGHEFADLQQDTFLSDAYADALSLLDRHATDNSGGLLASTDMGNVSRRIPSIHPMLGYDIGGAFHHTVEFTQHGVSESADEAIGIGAFGMAVAAAAAALNPKERKRLLDR